MAAACLAVGAAPALGEDSRVLEARPPLALIYDAQREAASSVALATALEEASFQDDVNALLDPMIRRYRSVYAGSEFVSPARVVVNFTVVPREVALRLGKDPRFDLRAGAVMGEDEAGRLAGELLDGLMGAESLGGESMSRVDPVTGSAEIVVSSATAAAQIRSKLDSVTRRSLPRAQTSGSSVPAVPSGVSVVVDSTLDFTEEALDGGTTLMLRNTNVRECTAGFSARSGSRAGLLTAEHCADNLTVGSGDNLYDAMPLKLAGAQGDAQWHRAKTAVSGNFRYDWSKFRPVWAHPVLKVGTKVCRFGQTTGTGSGCTTVKYVQACIKYDGENSSRCKLAMTATHTGSAGGDSGGPWYYGNNAYGIHSGSGWREGVRRNWFTSSARAISDLGLSPVYGAR